MDYLKYALEKQEINPDIEIFGGVGIEQINDAEKKLGILFPGQYKAFLLGCRWSSVMTIMMRNSTKAMAAATPGLLLLNAWS